jgi:putative flavoprotein involved in K+ transport
MTEGSRYSEAETWLSAFGSALASRDIGKAAALFGDECFWRDLAAFTWNVKTLEGREAIAAMLEAQLHAVDPTSWRVDGPPVLADGVLEAWIGFETKHSRGRGILRLRDGRAWTLLTAIEELKSFEERKARSRRSALSMASTGAARIGSRLREPKKRLSATKASPIASSSEVAREA